MVFYIVYESRESYPLGLDGLIKLLVDARRYNESADVSGLLVCRGGHFLQMLEGNELTVRNLFTVIAQDPRHTGLRILESGFDDQRLFVSWSMAYDGAPLLATGRPAIGSMLSDTEALERLSQRSAHHPAAQAIKAFLGRTDK